MPLSGSMALVTGGESGIGAAVVTRFLADGATVVSADISLPQGTVAEIGDRRLTMGVDVADEASVEALIAATVVRAGRIDCVVNCAGIGHDVPFLDTSAELFDRIMAINLRGTFLVGRAAARHMAEGGHGSIVNIASVSGTRASTGRAAYGASKAAVILMSQVMAVELGARGVRVNAIAPGPIETPLVARMHGPEIRKSWLDAMPIARYGTPEDVAAAAAFLAGPDSAFVTGHVLTVDGGFSAAGIMPVRAST